jgi:hypothetical protein
MAFKAHRGADPAINDAALPRHVALSMVSLLPAPAQAVAHVLVCTLAAAGQGVGGMCGSKGTA